MTLIDATDGTGKTPWGDDWGALGGWGQQNLNRRDRDDTGGHRQRRLRGLGAESQTDMADQMIRLTEKKKTERKKGWKTGCAKREQRKGTNGDGAGKR